MRKGFTLIELLTAVMLMAVIGMLLARFSQRVLRTMEATRVHATSAARLDGAMLALRGEVWDALKLHSASSRELFVVTGQGQPTHWIWAADGHLRQIDASGNTHDWGELPEVVMTVESAAVHVKVVDPGSGERRNVICAAAPLVLLQEKR